MSFFSHFAAYQMGIVAYQMGKAHARPDKPAKKRRVPVKKLVGRRKMAVAKAAARRFGGAMVKKTGHAILGEIAEKHGLPKPTHGAEPRSYIEYMAALLAVELGLVKPGDVIVPNRP